MEHIGKQVKVILKDGSQFEGFVHSMNIDTGKLALHKVTNEDGKKLQGIQHFFNDEIQNIYAFEKELLASSKNTEEKLVDKKESGRKMIHSKYVPAHLQRMRDFNRNSVLLSNISTNGVDNTVKQDNKSSDYDSSSDPETLEAGTNAPYVVINKMDRKYQDAIEAVLNCAVVGLAMQGVCIGRSGEVCWVQFATDRNVFLFDVLELSANCFEEGIKIILENPDILKVTHDCRLMSDYLFHCHNIKLVNVFDTQVADVFVDRLFKRGDWPRFVKGLADCALNNLDLEPEQVFDLKTREKCKKSDEEIWATRPISRQLLDALYKNVVHLRPLRQVLIEKMMAEYVAGVDVYLSQVRDSSMKDAKMHQANLLPMAFQGLRKLMPHYHSYQWNNNRKLDTETSNVKGFTDNVVPIRDPKVIISHDSIWHQGPYQGQHMFKQVASHLKFVNEDGTPVNLENHQKEGTSEKMENQRSVNTSTSSAISPHVSPVKKMDQTQPQNVGVPLSNGEEKRSPASPMKGLSHMKEVLEMQKAMKESELEEVSAGTLIRSVLKQTDPKKLEHKEEDDEAYAFRPAGVMIHAKKNDKTTTKRQREVDELELEMAQYVMENQNLENSEQEEQGYDDWGGTRKNLVLDTQEKKEDTLLKNFLAMAAKANAIKQSNFDHQLNSVPTYTSLAGCTVVPDYAAVRSPPSVVSDTQESLTSPQQNMQNYSTQHENLVSDDNHSVLSSDTLTQGSIPSSHQRSTSTGHLTQHRCLYRGQISRAKSPSPSQSGGSVLNTSLPSSFEQSISNQRSISLPTTPISNSERSQENPQQNGTTNVLNGATPSIANLSKLASIITKSSMRSTSSADREHSRDLTNSSVSSTPPKPTSSVQEASFTNHVLSAVHSSESSRSTTSVQKPSNNDSPHSSSAGMNGYTQNSVKSPESVSAALSSTNSKIQRLKILADAMKKPQ